MNTSRTRNKKQNKGNNQIEQQANKKTKQTKHSKTNNLRKAGASSGLQRRDVAQGRGYGHAQTGKLCDVCDGEGVSAINGNCM